MNGVISLSVPFSRDEARQLRCGDIVELSGTIYTARDAAHARMVEALRAGKPLPLPIDGQTIYYAGPTPARPGSPIGSCGPTTAKRMDSFMHELLDAGLAGTIGKGPRSMDVVDDIVAHESVYFASVGGAAALTSKCIVEAELVAYEDLGPEAVRRLVVGRYPCIVAVDVKGTSIFDVGPAKFRKAVTPPG